MAANKLFIKPKFKTECGFTLLEVLVAVVILGSTLAVLLGAVNRNLVLASNSKNLSIARMLAQDKISEVELAGYPENKNEEGEFEDFPGFKWYLSVSPLDISSLETDIKIVKLLITWDNDQKDFEITFAMADY
ncbi:MAG: prepilin-type N-terminal cleavage/methylation domain-containing protein [Candidatus Dadabacteria bacterium]|nr:prepilin-type N-terminal cleavage/methylation domain-containing protein [Candidatus Dadabacteria bacterium]NIS07356.1 prepilin-type N-terminal cleavage/methylation domain-containing protein [Candidatus Dadabacteria bacterium]NIV41300.1 prepilin-type N-terminal cleavage/methylation domain-containing protein [Candidatus Dadabacteria bacterium]NIX14535.1 prepilin-type N-terminal cleavage/methylation domain-containing protein [Candidatus Dadabacteria bacterium]NIY20993.1 prepilin-type N-terminal